MVLWHLFCLSKCPCADLWSVHGRGHGFETYVHRDDFGGANVMTSVQVIFHGGDDADGDYDDGVNVSLCASGLSLRPRLHLG